MKHIIILLGLIFSFSVANAQAGDQQTADQQRAHTQALRLKKNLNLSDDQTTKVEAVFLARIQEIAAITNDASKPAPQQQAEIDAVKKAKDNELATILTPDQFAQYKHLQEAKKERAQATSGQ